MTDKTISNIGKIGSDYFRLYYDKINSKKRLDFYLNQFDVNDYWIYKATNKQHQVIKDEFYDFKYAGYIFFKKDKYDNNEINKSLELIQTIMKGSRSDFKYLNKPLPPFEIIKKIKTIENNFK